AGGRAGRRADRCGGHAGGCREGGREPYGTLSSEDAVRMKKGATIHVAAGGSLRSIFTAVRSRLRLMLQFTAAISLVHAADESPALAQARRALTEGIPQIAIYELQAALNAPAFPSKDRPAARRMLAEALLATGNPAAALETLAEFTDSSDSAATLLRAHAYAASGRWPE